MFDIDVITQKKQKLLEVSNSLKKDFVGLDEVIDKIISSIEVWYIFPDLLIHPLIINLWGMTGVGKTDLVRKLVSKLSFRENYLEIQLNTSNNHESVQSKLIDLNISSNKQAILLLDEIQRFSTLDEQGKLIRDTGYNDIWELLSDGSFSDAYQEKYSLQMLLYELLYDKDAIDNNKEEDKEEKAVVTTKENKEKKTKERKFKNYIWGSNRFKKITESKLTIEEIMQLSLDDQIKIITDKLSSMDFNKERKKYNNLLIFISGNIDEAYSMSSDVSEVDTDADVLHEKSKKISILDIKNTLLKKFKPEQIARLGNNHIIYPSLSKNNFKDLIIKNLNAIKTKFYEISNIDIIYKDNIYEVIYQNGVFPSQGVRPLFSTINLLIENIIPEFLLKALNDNTSYICLSADIDNSCIVCEYNIKNETVKYSKKVQFEINKLKKEIKGDILALVAAHEIGHTVAYMNLFKTVPIQICCDAVNFANGFVIPHKVNESKDNILKLVQVHLAGKAMEEIIFGENNTSIGSFQDIYNATYYVSNMVRSYNMDGFVGVIQSEATLKAICTNMDDTNPIIEQILKEQKVKVTDLLQKNIKLIKVLVKELYKNRKLFSNDLYLIAKEYLPDLKILPLQETLEYNYLKTLNDFLD